MLNEGGVSSDGPPVKPDCIILDQSSTVLMLTPLLGVLRKSGMLWPPRSLAEFGRKKGCEIWLEFGC